MIPATLGMSSELEQTEYKEKIPLNPKNHFKRDVFTADDSDTKMTLDTEKYWIEIKTIKMKKEKQ